MKTAFRITDLDRSDQSGFTLVETLMVVAITGMILIPLFGWTFLVLTQSEDTGDRTEDVASVGRVRTTFARDVASAMSADTSGTDCPGGPGAGGTVRLVLTNAGSPTKRIVYSEAPRMRNGVAVSGQTSLWRRSCVGAQPTDGSQVIDGLSGVATVTCVARPNLPTPDTCGQVRLTGRTAQSSRLVSLSGARRWTGSSVAASLGGGRQAPQAHITKTQSDLNGYRNLIVNFSSASSTDADGTIVSYFWAFGDGATSTDPNPTHTYTAVGTYQVTLTVTDNDGAPRSAYDSVQVVNRAPVASINNSAASLTGPQALTVAFSSEGSSDSADPGGSISSYLWSFGDGTANSTLANPTHVYQQAGNYTVMLTVTDNNGGTASTTRSVIVTNSPPVVTSIGFACQVGTTPCASGVDNSAIGTITGSTMATAFTSAAADTDGGTVTAYEWSVSPTATISNAAAQNPTITFPAHGFYTVRVRVQDNNGAWSGYTIRTLKVNARPTASYTLTQSNPDGHRPITVDVNAGASSDVDGTVVAYSWTTNDGRTASGPNASFTWPNTALAGSRSITLTVTDDNGGTRQQTQTFTIVNRAPTAVLTTSPNPAAGPKPLAVTFNGSGSSDPDGTPLTYAWYVDNVQQAATTPTFSRTFTTTATFVVRLTVTDIDGATHSTSVSIAPTNVAPTASFNYTCQASTVPCVNGAAADSFIGTLAGGSYTTSFAGAGAETDGGTISAYQWSVTGGASTVASSSSATTNITFSQRGSYTVAFRVRDNDSQWSEWVEKVVVVNAPPTASFTAPSGGRAPTTRSFSGSANDPEGTSMTYLWTITGGPSTITSNSLVMSATLNTPGTYMATLRVTDANGGVTTTAPQSVVITGAPTPTLSGSSTGCTSWCFQNRRLTFTWNNPGQISNYQIEVNHWGTCGDATINVAGGSTTSVNWTTSCWVSATFDVRIRAQDSSTGLWGSWSSWSEVTS